MTGEAGIVSRSVASAALLATALLHVVARPAGAEEPPVDAADAEAAAEVAEEVVADSAEAPEAEPRELTAQETVEAFIVAPGGVPAEPADAKSAVETVKAAMSVVEEQSIEGVGEAYVIEFGDTFDWVQMVSGEWIKGNIERMRDDTLEFDSDELGMLHLDFADIALMHSPQVNTYVFDDRLSETGRAAMTADQIIIETKGGGTKVFPRGELESIVEGDRERDWWSMKLRFGLTLNRGNTDQLTYDIKFNARREDRMTLLDLGYNATFGRADGVQNVKRHLGDFQFNVFLGSRWWVTPAFGQFFNDTFQNIRFRATPAAGAGVHIIDKPNVTWDFQTGIGYQYLRFDDISMTPGIRNPQNDVFIPLFTYWDFDITGDIDLTMSWRTNLVVTTIGNTNHTGKIDLAIELTSVIDLDIAFLFLRTENPAPPADPTVDPPIEKNDYQLIVGVSLELG